MRSSTTLFVIVLCAVALFVASACVLLSPLWSLAANHVIEAGKSHTLTADLVLTGDDVLEVRGTAEKPCTLIGNNHRMQAILR